MELKKLKFSFRIGEDVYELPNAPTSWDENTVISITRSPVFFGMFRNLTVPLEFILDGAWFLRREFYTHKLSAKVNLIVEELVPSNYTYKKIYEGSLDFSTFDDTDNIVTINAMESGVSEWVKAYEKVVFEFPLNNPETLKIKLPGIGLTDFCDSIMEPTDFGFPVPFFTLQRKYIMATDIITNELLNQFVTCRSQELESFFEADNPLDTSLNWYVQANEATNISINFTLEGEYGLRRTNQKLKIVLRNQNNVLRGQLAEFVGVVSGNNFIPFNFNNTVSIALEANEKLFIMLEPEGPDHNYNSFVRISRGAAILTNNLVTVPTFARGFRPKQLFQNLINKMASTANVLPSDYPEVSSFLLDEWDSLLITCGDSIRGIQDAVLKTSFIDFFDSMNAILSAGFGVENGKPVLENKTYFTRNAVVLSVGEVSDFNLKVAADYLFSDVKVGYEDNDYDTAFGKEEYNSEQNWSSPVTRSQKTLNLISPYRADQFGIEELRVIKSLGNATKEDSDSDNDVFVIKTTGVLTEDFYEVESDENYTNLQGVSSRNAYYNLAITPKKNLLRHGSYLRGCLDGYENRSLRFESAAKNVNLSTVDLQGLRVLEKEWIQINTLPKSAFLPYTVSFVVPIKYALDQLSANMYGEIEFIYRGDKFYGFIIDNKLNVPTSEPKEWKLLLSSKSDLRKLIR